MALSDIDGGWKDVGYRNVSIIFHLITRAKVSVLPKRRSMAMVRIHSFPRLMEDCVCPSP